MRRAAAALLLLCTARAAAQPRITKPPRLLRFVAAEYPAAREAAGETAEVVLRIDLGADGRPTRVTVAQGAAPDFDAAAVAAAQQFVFEPAEVDGKPAPVTVSYRYRFTIATELIPLAPQVNFDGDVVDRFSQQPVAGVTVTIAGLRAETDESGHFSFTGVPPGSHAVALAGPALVPVSTEETIAPGVRRTVRYLVEPEPDDDIDDDEVVRAPRLKKEAAEVAIPTEEARKVPGTAGDTLQVVQNLPGVARAAVGSGQLVVWGAAPRDTRVLVDGVEIPALYHVGGVRSTVNADLVRSITLIPGAYGAEYGRGLGGLVLVATRSLPAGVHGYLGADVIDGSAMLALGRGRWRVAAAARVSWLDRVLGAVVADDVGDFFPIGRYRDAQLEVTRTLGPGEQLQAMWLASHDALDRTVASRDPASARAQHETRDFQRVFLRWTRAGRAGSAAVTPFAGFDDRSASAAFGAAPTRLTVRALCYGVRAWFRGRVARGVRLAVGLDGQGTRSRVARVGSLTLPPREGDVTVFGQAPADDLASDQWTAHVVDVAPYVSAEVTAGRLSVTPGLRADAYAIAGSRLLPRIGATPSIGHARLEWALDPRITAKLRVSRRVELIAAGGVYHQPPEPEDLSAVFGSPRLGLARALHGSLGGAVRLGRGVRAEVTGFYARQDGLAVRSRLPTPRLAEALVQDGEGRSYGAQLLLRRELAAGLFGWVSYAWSRSERRAGGEAWRLFDHEQTHVLAVVASYAALGFTFGARFRLATGVPRTSVVGAYYDARADRHAPLLGRHNGTRVPLFAQLDLRVERELAHRLTAYLDVQNVTGRDNAEEIVYSHDFAEKDYLTGLPTLVVAGARWEF